MNAYMRNESNVAMKLHYEILKDDFSRDDDVSSKIKNMIRKLMQIFLEKLQLQLTKQKLI